MPPGMIASSVFVMGQGSLALPHSRRSRSPCVTVPVIHIHYASQVCARRVQEWYAHCGRFCTAYVSLAIGSPSDYGILTTGPQQRFSLSRTLSGQLAASAHTSTVFLCPIMLPASFDFCHNMP